MIFKLFKRKNVYWNILLKTSGKLYIFFKQITSHIIDIRKTKKVWSFLKYSAFQIDKPAHNTVPMYCHKIAYHCSSSGE